MKQPLDVTYLADTVIMLRYFEATGRVRRAMSVVKKRTGATRGHDPRVPHRFAWHHGSASHCANFRACLRGVPNYVGAADAADAGDAVTSASAIRAERTLILAPRGRDAVVAKGILTDARLGRRYLRRSRRAGTRNPARSRCRHPHRGSNARRQRASADGIERLAAAMVRFSFCDLRPSTAAARAQFSRGRVRQGVGQRRRCWSGRFIPRPW